MQTNHDPRRDRNFWLLVGDAVFFSIGLVCFDPNVVLTVFVAQFTTAPVLIGAPAALRLAGLYLPQLPTALGIRRFRLVKGFLMWQVVLGRAALLATLVAVVLSALLRPDAVLAVVLVAFAIFAFTDGASALAWLDLVGDVVHRRLRGSFFGTVQLLGGLGSIGAGLVVRGLLSDRAGVSSADFIPLFTWGCVAFLLSAVCIGFIHEPRDRIRPPLDESAPEHVAKLLRGGHLLRLGVAQILASSIQMALPFYVLFGRDRLGLSTDWLGGFIIAQTAGATISGLGWARIAERYGARVVVSLSAVVLILLPLLTLSAEQLGSGLLLLVVFGLAGAANGGAQSAFAQYVLDLVPPADRRVFMGLANTANAPSLLMPIAGGLLLGWGGYGLLFAGSVVGGIGAAVSALWLTTPE